MPNVIVTKLKRTWRQTIGGWVLVDPNPHHVWIAHRDPMGYKGWLVRLQGDTDRLWTFRAKTLDEAATRILTHPLAPRDPLPAALPPAEPATPVATFWPPDYSCCCFPEEG